MSAQIAVPAIDARGIRRVYAAKPEPVTALAGVDLEVEPGELFGLLGPNGAGKTTLIKILTTLLLPSAGTARVFGFDIERDTKKIRRIMNMVAGGEQSGYGILTVREQLWMFSQFYGLPAREGWARVDELIEAVGLDEQRLQRVSGLSTGQRQKMNFARGPAQRSVDPVPRRADPRSGRLRGAGRPRADHGLAGGRARVGRSCSRPTTSSRPTSSASGSRSSIAAVSWRSARRPSSSSGSSASRSSGSSSTGSPAARPPSPGCPGVVSATAATAGVGLGDDADPRQTVEVNLVLVDDGALGGVVGALGGLGSRILALRKSEPTLEEVFVELVGRGFHDE